MDETTEQTQETTATPAQLLAVGLQHHQCGRLAEAKQSYVDILAVDPENFDALHLLGILAHQVGNHDLAVNLIERAVQQKADNAVAYNNLGEAYKGAKRLEDAVRCYRQALALNPELPEVCCNLGNALKALGRLDEAAAAYRQGLAIKPEFALVHYNLGSLLKEQGRLDEAEASFREALQHKPDFSDASAALAQLKLLQGNYREGFHYFAHGVPGEPACATRKETSRLLAAQQLWQGEPLAGRRLLLVTEQGAGDNLMMMRYLPAVKALGPDRLTIYATPHLARVFLNQGVADEVISMTTPLPVWDIDLYCPMMALPHLLQTDLDTLPATVPYLHLPTEVDDHWRTRVEAVKGLKVGLCWAAGKLSGNHARRSIALEKCRPFSEIGELQLVSLQQGKDVDQLPGAGFNLFNCMDECKDFLDTAGLIAQLDLVISVDTAVAHLAGAMGKPVWLLNSAESDWRWMAERNDSPWYPTMRIYRQKERGDWDGVIAEAVEQLALFASLSS